MCDMQRCTVTCTSIAQPIIQVMHKFILCTSRGTSNTVVVTHYILQAIASFDGVTVRSPCRSGVVRASSRSFVWVSIAYPGVVWVGVERSSRIEKIREEKASTYRGSKTREIRLSDLSESLEILKRVHTGEETEMSEFHSRTSLELVHRCYEAYIQEGGVATTRYSSQR